MSTLVARIRPQARRVALVALTMAFLASPAAAAPITFSSPLAPEVPGATGSGFVTVVYDDVANTLRIDATWSGLSGTTTVAHIHCCTAVPGTGTVGVAVTPGTLPGFPVGLSEGSYTTSPFLDLSATATYTAAFRMNFGGNTVSGAEAALLAGILSGSAYFNVHTTAFPGGEIRGFLAPVPEPGVLTLLGAALALGTLRRRRQ